MIIPGARLRRFGGFMPKRAKKKNEREREKERKRRGELLFRDAVFAFYLQPATRARAPFVPVCLALIVTSPSVAGKFAGAEILCKAI